MDTFNIDNASKTQAEVWNSVVSFILAGGIISEELLRKSVLDIYKKDFKEVVDELLKKVKESEKLYFIVPKRV